MSDTGASPSDLVKRLRKRFATRVIGGRLLFGSDRDPECQEAATAIEQLTAERDALLQDAKRYQWLRANTRGERRHSPAAEFVLPYPQPKGNIMQGSVAEHLDTA